MGRAAVPVGECPLGSNMTGFLRREKQDDDPIEVEGKFAAGSLGLTGVSGQA